MPLHRSCSSINQKKIRGRTHNVDSIYEGESEVQEIEQITFETHHIAHLHQIHITPMNPEIQVP